MGHEPTLPRNLEPTDLQISSPLVPALPNDDPTNYHKPQEDTDLQKPSMSTASSTSHDDVAKLQEPKNFSPMQVSPPPEGETVGCRLARDPNILFSPRGAALSSAREKLAGSHPAKDARKPYFPRLSTTSSSSTYEGPTSPHLAQELGTFPRLSTASSSATKEPTSPASAHESKGRLSELHTTPSSAGDGKRADQFHKEKTKKRKKKELAVKTLELARMLYTIQTTIQQHNEDMEDFDEVFEEIECAHNNIAKSLGGCQLIWKIENFSKKLKEAHRGQTTTLFSPEFETHSHGYNMSLSLCPNGDGRGKGEYMSIFFCLQKGRWDSLLPWPFCCEITFTVLDQSDNDTVYDVSAKFTPNPIHENTPFLGRPTKRRNPSLGLPKFISHAVLLGEGCGQFIKDNTIFIKVEVDTLTVQRS